MTGASRGIGLAIAESFAREGAYVVRVARTLQPGYDVTREADVDRLAASLRTEGRVPDILVNNAGSFLLKPLVDTTPAEFRSQIETNLVAAFLVLRAFVPAMRARGSGDIVTIGSVADHVALPGNAAYGASKHGLRALHDVLTLELKGSGVRTTLISPSATDTSMWDVVDRRANPGLPERSSMLRPEDVALQVIHAVI